MTYYQLHGYHRHGFDNIYETITKIKHNREMIGNICRNMKLPPPCIPLPQYN